MISRKLLLAATATASLAYAVALSPLMMSEAFGQQNPPNPTMTNVVPDGGNFAAEGRLQTLDPAAMTLTIVTQRAGAVPMTVAPGVQILTSR